MILTLVIFSESPRSSHAFDRDDLIDYSTEEAPICGMISNMELSSVLLMLFAAKSIHPVQDKLLIS